MTRGPNFWTCLLFSFASFHAPGGVDLGNISPGLVLPQEHNSLLGLGATTRGTSGTPVAAMAEQIAYFFWMVLTFLCHFLQVLVGGEHDPTTEPKA